MTAEIIDINNTVISVRPIDGNTYDLIEVNRYIDGERQNFSIGEIIIIKYNGTLSTTDPPRYACSVNKKSKII